MRASDFLVLCFLLLILLLVIGAAASMKAASIDESVVYMTGEQTSLPFSVIGDDYLLFNGNTGTNPNGTAGVWDTGKLEKMQTYGCNTARLVFSFTDITGYDPASYYDSTKMSNVLDRLSNIGVKGILCHGDAATYIGSANWTANWLTVTNDFLGDDRVEAFQIVNEPYSAQWDASVTDVDSLVSACAGLIDSIRAVDPDRAIVFPTIYGIASLNQTEIYDAISTYGIVAKGNIIFDVYHPYWWEYPTYDGTTSPTTRVDTLCSAIIDPYISRYGVDNCWIGETFPFSPSETSPSGSPYTTSVQLQFSVAMINACVNRGLGLQMWCYFSRQSNYSYTTMDSALTNSNYLSTIEEEEESNPPIPPPPIEYYYVNVSADVGGQVDPVGEHQVQVGTTFWVHASADEDYTFSHWTKNDLNVSSNPNYPINDGYADLTYFMVAYFDANPPTPPDTPSNPGATYYSVNVEGSTGLTLSLTGIQTLEAGAGGESLTVSVAKIAENWRFTYWLYDSTTKYYSSTVTVGPEASDTAHTLLAVSQAVEPPPPNQTIPPASASVGIVSASPLFRQITRKVKKQKPVDLRKLFKSLKKAKL